MRKFLALLLAATMVFGLVACGDTTNDDTINNDDSAESDSSATNGTDTDTYTYNYALSSFPDNWNVFVYETSAGSEIADYIGASFYTFDYNDTMDGYEMVDDMAVGDPVDVTSDYIGQYGLEEGATSRAWLVNLRTDLKWEDGTAITANDFVESFKRLLDPVAKNYRADGLYTGSAVIHNAQSYLFNGQYSETAENMISENYGDDEYIAIEDLLVNDDGQYYVEGKGEIWLNINDGGNWGSYGLDTYVGAYCDEEHQTLYAEQFAALADSEGNVAITPDTVQVLCELIANMQTGATIDDYAASVGDYAYLEWEEFSYYGRQFDEMDFSEVGVFAKSDYELVFVLDLPLSGFYLKYNLPGSYLVNIDLYDSLGKIEDGVYTNTYGTSVETTMSYGPYKLTSFQKDKQFILERNDQFYEFNDRDDIYQADRLVCQYMPEASTRLESFLQGKLDTYGLQSEDMATYQMSDYTYYATGASTFAVAFNPGLSQLEEKQAAVGANINKTILTIKEFRMAMGFSLDRAAFCLATSPTNKPAFGLYSNLIISDPDEGTAYRTTDQAKQVLADFWGLTDDIGEGKLYATLDDAVDSITGYDLARAQELFNEAYDIAIEQGLMDEDDVIQLTIGLAGTSSFYTNGYEYLKNNWEDAVKGTKLEGKLTFVDDRTIDSNTFADALKNNQVDILFGVGWTGSALDPYGLAQVYVKSSYVYDPNTNYDEVTADITIDGVDYTAPVYNWYNIMNGIEDTATTADGTEVTLSFGSEAERPDVRLDILAALEGAVLDLYNYQPVMDQSTAQLRGQKINYKTEEYIYGMGFGTIKYYTFNYTDAEWDAYVQSNGGTLDYT